MKQRQQHWPGVMVWIMIGLLQLGCTALPVPIITQTALPLPVRPVLPAIKADELACLSDDTYLRLAARNRLQRQYAERLEVIIKSTRPSLGESGAVIGKVSVPDG